MALPFVDMIMAVIRRLANGQSPFKPDRLHLHHRLLKMGHSHRRAVLVMYLWAFYFSVLAVCLLKLDWVAELMLALLGGITCLIVTISYLPGLRSYYARGFNSYPRHAREKEEQ